MIKVTGGSDDIIQVKGDIQDEFNRFDSEGDYLAFSDGTVLKAVYDQDGIWRLTTVYQGTLLQGKIDGIVADDTNDIVTFADGIKWVVCGPDLARR